MKIKSNLRFNRSYKKHETVKRPNHRSVLATAILDTDIKACPEHPLLSSLLFLYFKYLCRYLLGIFAVLKPGFVLPL